MLRRALDSLLDNAPVHIGPAAPHAYARRRERYGGRLLCVRCLTEGWLRTRAGQYQQEQALRDETAGAGRSMT